MQGLPDAIYVVDPKKEDIAVREARILHIPVVAIIDTNCDPDIIDYPIPGNDDAIRAVKLLTETMANAVLEAKQGEELQEMEIVDEPASEESEEVTKNILIEEE